MKKSIYTIFMKVSMAIPALLIVLGCFFKCIYYIQSDDYEMNIISMGGVSGKPDEHLIFIKAVLGYILKSFYNLNNNINWYGVFYLLTIILCIYTIFFVIKKYINYVWALIVTILIEIVILSWLTFTVLAYFCIFAAIIKLCDFCGEKEKKNKIFNLFVIIFEIIIAYLLRVDSFYSGILLIVPMILCFIKRKDIKIISVVSLVSIILIVGVNIIESNAYESELWQKYKTYNYLRSQVSDFPINDYETHKDEYEKLNLSENDYNCLKGWRFSDNIVFSPEVLREVVNNKEFNVRYNVNFIDLVKNITGNKEFWLFLCTYLCLLVISNKKKYQVFQMIFVYGLVAVLFFINRGLLRVYVAIYAVGFLAMLCIYTKNKEKRLNKEKIFIYFIFIIIASLSTLYIRMDYKNITDKRTKEKIYASEVKYINNNIDKFFVIDRMTSIMENKSILDMKFGTEFVNVLDLGHWSIYNDTYYMQAEKYKFTYVERLYLNLVYNDNFYYICNNSINNEVIDKYLMTFLNEHIDKELVVEKIAEFEDSGDIVYKLSIKE